MASPFAVALNGAKARHKLPLLRRQLRFHSFCSALQPFESVRSTPESYKLPNALVRGLGALSTLEHVGSVGFLEQAGTHAIVVVLCATNAVDVKGASWAFPTRLMPFGGVRRVM